jgi:hypothetical protein
MLNQHEAYLRKAESFEKVARRLRDRTDPVGRKVFSSAEWSARRFRHLAETLVALEEQRTPARTPGRPLQLRCPGADGHAFVGIVGDERIA